MKTVTVVGLMSVLFSVSAALPLGDSNHKDMDQNRSHILPPIVLGDGNLEAPDLVSGGRDAVQRKKKSTVIANICVEVKPSSPDKPYQLCETKDQKNVAPVSISDSSFSSSVSSGLDTKYKPGYPQANAKAGAAGYNKPAGTPQTPYTSKYPYTGMYREASDSEQEAASDELDETSDSFLRNNERLPSTDLEVNSDESDQSETPLLEENDWMRNNDNMRTVHNHEENPFGNRFMNFKSFDKKKDSSNKYGFGDVESPGRYASWGGDAYPSYKPAYPEQLYSKHKYQAMPLLPGYQPPNYGFMQPQNPQFGTYGDANKGLYSHPQYVQNPMYPTIYKPTIPSYQYPPHYPQISAHPSYIQHSASNALSFNGRPFSPYVPPPTYRMAQDEIDEGKNLEGVGYDDINRDGVRGLDGANPFMIDKEAATMEHMKKIAAARKSMFRNQQAPMNFMGGKQNNDGIPSRNSN